MSGPFARFDALSEHVHHFQIQRILQYAVLVAGIDIRIVVDFDDIALPAALLDVDAVETVADQVRRAQRQIEHLRRRGFKRDGLRLAFAYRAAALVPDDLPMAGRHEIAAYE